MRFFNCRLNSSVVERWERLKAFVVKSVKTGGGISLFVYIIFVKRKSKQMDKLSPTNNNICILCINTTSKMTEIFDSRGHVLKIAEILSQHFWFTFSATDKSKKICVECWDKTNVFHQFYESVREAHRHQIDNQSKDEDSVQPDWQSDDCDSDVAMNADDDVDEDATSLQLEPMVNADADAKITQPSETSMSATDDDKQMCQPLDSLINSDEDVETTSQTLPLSTADRDILDVESRIAEYFKMSCDLCGQKFTSLNNVKGHFTKKHNLDRGYLICCCNKKAKMRKAIIEHVQWHMNPNMFRCNECSKTFNDKQGLRKHTVKHHAQAKDQIDCRLCTKQFKSQRLLTEHTTRVHPPDDQKFTCDICQKHFKLKVILEAHIKYKHSGTAQQYICDICAKVLSTKQNLKEHTNTHFDIPRVKCNVCGALLKNRICLAIHMKSHTDSQQTCDICLEVKANRSALSNHKRRVHGTAKHKCNFCAKSFTRLSALREHVATHTGESLYTCKYCPQTFKSDANMYKHMKQVHAEQWANDRKRR